MDLYIIASRPPMDLPKSYWPSRTSISVDQLTNQSYRLSVAPLMCPGPGWLKVNWVLNDINSSVRDFTIWNLQALDGGHLQNLTLTWHSFSSATFPVPRSALLFIERWSPLLSNSQFIPPSSPSTNRLDETPQSTAMPVAKNNVDPQRLLGSMFVGLAIACV